MKVTVNLSEVLPKNQTNILMELTKNNISALLKNAAKDYGAQEEDVVVDFIKNAYFRCEINGMNETEEQVNAVVNAFDKIPEEVIVTLPQKPKDRYEIYSQENSLVIFDTQKDEYITFSDKGDIQKILDFTNNNQQNIHALFQMIRKFE